MRRFDLHQDKAEKKSKDLFLQMVVVQGVTLLVSGLVLGLFFTLMFYLISERQHRRTHRRGFYSTHQTQKDLGPDQYITYVGRHRRPCLLYTSPSPRDQRGSRMPSSA